MSSPSTVVARGLVKNYGARRALNGVDLEVAPGQLHGLLGPNGAGKTTLLRVLLGLARRDAGIVRLLGVDRAITAGPLPDGVAGFADAPAFYPYLSGIQNLSLLTRLDSPATAARPRAIEDALERVGLTGHADTRVSGYSTGMRQRLAVAGHCCGRRACCCSTSRRVRSIPPARATFARSPASSPTRARPSS